MSDKFLSIPFAALSEAVAIIARTGAGKSYTARGLVERLMSSGARVTILDPTGVWWGLRLLADGKTRSEFPVVILGGDYGDIPITADNGNVVAGVVIEHRTSFIIDLSGFGVGERNRFCEAFFDTLYRNKPRGPMHLIADEADCYAPQKPMRDQLVMASRFEQIVRRGRVRGFRPMMITQRTAVINKDVLNMAGTMIALQLTGPQDRDALERWIEFNAAADKVDKVMRSLPSLAQGEGWLWVPRSGILERGRFPKIKTFDSMRAPDHDEDEVRLPALGADDIAKLGREFEKMVADARQNSPEAMKEKIKALESRISDLDGMLQDAEHGRAAPVSSASIEAARVSGHKEGFAAGVRQGYRNAIAAKGTGTASLLKIMRSYLGPIGGQVRAAIEAVDSWEAEQIESDQLAEAIKAGNAAGAQVEQLRDPVAYAEKIKTDGDLSGGALRALKVLAQRHPARLTYGQWATLSFVRASSSTWRAYLAQLRRHGLIEEHGQLFTISAVGMARAGQLPKIADDFASRFAMWKAAVGSGAARVLDALAAVHPAGLSDPDLGRKIAVDPSTSTFRAYLAPLNANELIVKTPEGRRKLADTLFG